MIKRLLRVLSSPAVKWAFLVVALGAAVWYIVANGPGILAALAGMPAWTVLAALVLGMLYVFLTLLSWRALLTDLGHDIGLGPAAALFGVSQLGKYIPGGVWNIAAAADLGRAHRIPARHSVAAMTLAIMVSLTSGVAVGALGLAIAPTESMREWRWVLWLVVPFAVVLAPPILNRLIALAWRVLRLEPLETTLSVRGIGLGTAWAVAAWLVAGASVAVLSYGLGAAPSWTMLTQSTGGYAIAWVIGFLVVFAPAGAGVRELVLAAAFAGTLPAAAVGTLVLLSRVVLTVVDLAFAGFGALYTRRRRRTG